MNKYLAVGLGVFCFLNATHAALYLGNGDTSDGGAVGLGSLNLSDNGTTVSATFNKGGSAGTGFNDVLVLFIDSKAGGFTDTTHFSDASGSLQQAISGINTTGSARSTAIFASGFAADYAIALGFDNGIAVYHLVSGGNGSLELVRTLSFSPHDSKTQPTYNFSFTWADVGLSSGSGNTIKFESTYITASGARKLESFESLTGAVGFDNTVTFGNYDTYPLAPVPEPAQAALTIFGTGAISVAIFRWIRRRVDC